MILKPYPSTRCPQERLSSTFARTTNGSKATRAGAVHIPLGELPVRFEELDPDTDTYVICRTGGRSAQAAAWLVSQGYTALLVAGGMGDWLEAGLPLRSENGQEPTVR